MISWWWILLFAGAAATWLIFRRLGRRGDSVPTPLVEARQRFHLQRERLEAKFVQLASAHAGADAPRWADCDFDDGVAYVRNRTTGQISAFVAVTVAAEDSTGAVADCSTGAVGHLQAGTAIFRFDRDHWETDGRAILNLSPTEVAQRFGDLEIVGEETACPSRST